MQGSKLREKSTFPSEKFIENLLFQMAKAGQKDIFKKKKKRKKKIKSWCYTKRRDLFTWRSPHWILLSGSLFIYMEILITVVWAHNSSVTSWTIYPTEASKECVFVPFEPPEPLYARWAHMHCLLSVCMSVTRPKIIRRCHWQVGSCQWQVTFLCADSVFAWWD